MKYYSTNGKAPIADLNKAVVKGLAEDRGLYMPERINKLPKEFFNNIEQMNFQEIAYTVACAFFGAAASTCRTAPSRPTTSSKVSSTFFILNRILGHILRCKFTIIYRNIQM